MLSDWVNQILAQSRSQLNAHSERAAEEITALSDGRNLPTSQFDPLSDDLQRALHVKLCGSRSEEAIWSEVIGALNHPLIPEIAHDLLDRHVAQRALEHSRQTDDVQWRTAAFGGEALLTLAIECYCMPERSVAEMQALLDRFGDNAWMLQTLAHHDASSAEKERAYRNAITTHTDASEFLHIMELRRMVAEVQSPNLTQDDIQRLFASNEPEVWVYLAMHPETPRFLFEGMADIRNIKFARYIRHYAHQRLNKRH
jgi:hypothetical protein